MATLRAFSPLHASIGFVIAAVSLTVGIFAGRATVEPTPPPETYMLPPLSTQNMPDWERQSWCVKNRAFAEFAYSYDPRNRRQVQDIRVVATPLSDRGVICSIEGTLRQYSYNGNAVQLVDFSKTLIVAVGGDAEFVTPEFARALSQSPALKAMASNLGNDGTVMPSVRIKF